MVRWDAGSADGALTVNRIGEEAALVGGGSGAKPGGNAKAVTPRASARMAVRHADSSALQIWPITFRPGRPSLTREMTPLNDSIFFGESRNV